MSDWKQQIEAQIEELRDYKCISLQCCNKQNAAANTMQALLDVAVAADVLIQVGPRGASLQDWIELYVALDKLREVGDE
jgi:hypothetical protein